MPIEKKSASRASRSASSAAEGTSIITPSAGGAESPVRAAIRSKHRARRLELGQRRDHGQQDAERSGPGREAERGQLLLEEIGVREAVADAAQPQRGVLAGCGRDALLAAEIVGPHDDGVRRRRARAASRRRRAAPRSRASAAAPGGRETPSGRGRCPRPRSARVPGSPRAARGSPARRSRSRRAVTAARARAAAQPPAALPVLPARGRGSGAGAGGVGAISTRPRSPSTMIGRSGETASHRPAMPTTAGRPKERAMIEAWDVGPPRSSASARTRRGSRRAASTGESSSATRIESAGQLRRDLAALRPRAAPRSRAPRPRCRPRARASRRNPRRRAAAPSSRVTSASAHSALTRSRRIRSTIAPR